jgi:hypothetical protein
MRVIRRRRAAQYRIAAARRKYRTLFYLGSSRQI